MTCFVSHMNHAFPPPTFHASREMSHVPHRTSHASQVISHVSQKTSHVSHDVSDEMIHILHKTLLT